MRDWTARWQQTWRTLHLAPPPEPELTVLLARYREPQRHYHTLQHLAECFDAFDQLRDQATQTHEAGDDPDCAIMLDVDLAILSAPPARFADYERQIRAEYAHVPDDAYRTGQARVLAAFARREPLYRTARFQALYEQQAKWNMPQA